LPAGVAIFLLLSSYSVFGSIRNHARATLALTSPYNPSWIDQRIGSRTQAAFLYGATTEPFGEAQIMWQTEFWNRSVGTVYTLGPPDPGLTGSPATLHPATGRITPQRNGGSPSTAIRYAIVPTNLQLAGSLIAKQGRLALYRIDPPMRLATYLGGVDPDSWMSSLAALNHYAIPRRRGRLQVRLTREGWAGPSPPGRVTIKVGRLVDVGGLPGIGRVAASRTGTVRSGTASHLTIPTPRTPYRLEIHVEPTFSPANYGHPDTRQLGAQVAINAS
jgi:hypothetical protein